MKIHFSFSGILNPYNYPRQSIYPLEKKANKKKSAPAKRLAHYCRELPYINSLYPLWRKPVFSCNPKKKVRFRVR